MTHRDRAGDPLGQRAGSREAAVLDIQERLENILPGIFPVVAGMFRNQPESFDEPRTIKQFIFQRDNGAARRNRTSDPALTKGVLYL